MVKAELSAIVVTRCSYREVGLLMRLLANQTIASRMEIVFCYPKGGRGDLPQAIASCFASIVRLETPSGISPALSRALGIEKVSAPLVVLTEEHCFPNRSWAEHLVAAHGRADWAAVSPVFHNANPKFAESWAQFLLEYGDFAFPHPGGELPCLPGHNCCYRTARLREVGPDLVSYLSNETLFHWTMKEHGWRYHLEAESPCVPHQYYDLECHVSRPTVQGRPYDLQARASKHVAAASRASFYFSAHPAIPLLRLVHGRKLWHRAHYPRQEAAPSLHLIGGLIRIWFGEMVGSVLGWRWQSSHFSPWSSSIVAASLRGGGAHRARHVSDRGVRSPLRHFWCPRQMIPAGWPSYTAPMRADSGPWAQLLVCGPPGFTQTARLEPRPFASVVFTENGAFAGDARSNAGRRVCAWLRQRL